MNIMRIRPLAELPNRDNFEFVGIRRDRTPAECFIAKDRDTGAHSIAGAAKYHDLIGWIPVCK